MTDTNARTGRWTAGPWLTAPSPISSAVDGIHGADGSWVCDVPRALVGTANATLISLAPELVEALRGLLSNYGYRIEDGWVDETYMTIPVTFGDVRRARALLARLDQEANQ